MVVKVDLGLQEANARRQLSQDWLMLIAEGRGWKVERTIVCADEADIAVGAAAEVWVTVAGKWSRTW